MMAQKLRSDPPIDVVQRTRSADGYIFDRPSLVVLMRVQAETRTELSSDEPGSIVMVQKTTPYWTYVTGVVIEPIRVNERKDWEPDLADGNLMVEQRDRGEHPMDLQLGHLYVLLLKPSPDLIGNWNPARANPDSPPPYALAVPQAGFEIVNGRLRVLKKGGPLDAYDGGELSDMLQGDCRAQVRSSRRPSGFVLTTPG